MMKFFLVVCGLLLMMLRCAGTETDTGQLQGYVVDEQKNPIGSAVVILREREASASLHRTLATQPPPITGRSDTTRTTENGLFVFNSLRKGAYYLEVNDRDKRGAVVDGTLPQKGAPLIPDTIVVREFGAIRGSIDRSLVKGDSTFIYVIELDRRVPVDSLGYFLIGHVAAYDYSIRLIENRSFIPSVLDTVVIAVAVHDTATVFGIGNKPGSMVIHGIIHEN
jgi:hypothetical protein